MTAANFAAELASVADEALFRTNPVWCVERLLKRWEQHDATWAEIPTRLPLLLNGLARRGLTVPPVALARWSREHGVQVEHLSGPATPGVVGLSVDVGCDEAFVVPLLVERADEWRADPTLPFRPASVVQDLVLHLLDAHHLTRSQAVPERFAFSIRDPLERRTNGPSMLVAAVLAIVRVLGPQPPLLDGCCAVVQPDGDRLVPCGGIQSKLDAFVREYGSGTLLVRTAECTESSAYDRCFDVVWQVTTLQDLARQMADQGWLAPFLTNEPLQANEAVAATARAQRLEQVEHRYGQALDLLNRVVACGFRPDVAARFRRTCQQSIIDLYRHLGAYVRSAELAAGARSLTQASPVSCYDELAQADATYAAAHYAAHRFDEMRELLDPWRESLAADPRRVSAMTRVMVFNTLGRALSASGKDGWYPLFESSESLLEEVDPSDLPRTWSYMAHALLRSARYGEAAAILTRIERHTGLAELSRWFLRFMQADLARRSGELWSDPVMERSAPSPRVGHPSGLYLQATARQPGRTTEDAVARFRAARKFFTLDRPDGDERNIQSFLSDSLLLAEAAWSNDGELWHRARRAVERHLAVSSENRLCEYYEGYMPPDGCGPDRTIAERLLSRVPFF